MDTEKLLKLRNLLNSNEGELLLVYLHDYVTETACKSREALEIKGMCELIQKIKDIPKTLELRRKK